MGKGSRRTDVDDRKDEIEAWLRSGISQRECAKRLMCKIDTLRSRLKDWGLSDLKNQPGSGRPKPGNRVSVWEFIGPSGRVIGSHQLKLLLWRDGVKKKECENCGIMEWQGQPAPLELDHVDGNNYNNAIENLRILCANCHAIQPTNSGKNIGSYNAEVA